MTHGAGTNRVILRLVIAFLLGAACTAASRLATANPLGCAIGAIGLLTVVTPPLALAVRQKSQKLILLLSLSAGFALAWIVVAREMKVLVVVLVYLFALAGSVNALRALRLPIAFAAAITTLLALLWLSWPVWLAPHVQDERAVAWLVARHPIMTINGVLRDSAVWTQQPLMYRLTTLGQDVPYSLPPSIWPCVVVHGLIGLLLLLKAPEDDARFDR